MLLGGHGVTTEIWVGDEEFRGECMAMPVRLDARMDGACLVWQGLWRKVTAPLELVVAMKVVVPPLERSSLLRLMR